MRDEVARYCTAQVVVGAAELRALRLTDRARAAAVASGELLRLRRDSYCLPGVPRDVTAAVAAGGRLGCISALRAAGIWVTSRAETVHVSVAPNAA